MSYIGSQISRLRIRRADTSTYPCLRRALGLVPTAEIAVQPTTVPFLR